MRKPVRGTPPWVAPAATVGAVALLIAAFLAFRYLTTPALPPAPSADTTAAVLASITSVPSSELDQVGLGSATKSVVKVSGSPLAGSGGKPVIFYYGAEYCPFCAAERWPLIIALSRFGSFAGLTTTTSSSSDVFADTPTFTFHTATYTSQYIDFQSVESTDRNRQPLQNPSAAQQAVISQLDPSQVIPFIDLGGRYALTQASYQPSVLSGMTWQQVADALSNPGSSQAQAILGSANMLSAAMCALTSNQPSTACTPAIQAIEPKL